FPAPAGAFADPAGAFMAPPAGFAAPAPEPGGALPASGFPTSEFGFASPVVAAAQAAMTMPAAMPAPAPAPGLPGSELGFLPQASGYPAPQLAATAAMPTMPAPDLTAGIAMPATGFPTAPLAAPAAPVAPLPDPGLPPAAPMGATVGTTGTAYLGKADKALAFARAQIGRPCVWGATGPESYDPSGLNQAAWKAAGVSLPRATLDQARDFPRVGLDELRPGDLVFFHDDLSHTGLVSGSGMMIHAPRPGAPIREEPILAAGQDALRGAVRPS
ncbi:C40 family peptidase, partial [Streptomyces phaeofaciens]|uniref:C40 family peptidase n=1 Tax=Streptomyces phaeofaciens TaxID=68254 RepID=UPI0036752EB4